MLSNLMAKIDQKLKIHLNLNALPNVTEPLRVFQLIISQATQTHAKNT